MSLYMKTLCHILDGHLTTLWHGQKTHLVIYDYSWRLRATQSISEFGPQVSQIIVPRCVHSNAYAGSH